jgi:hypothetical protein
MASFQQMFGGRKRGSGVWKYFDYNEQKKKSTCLIEKPDSCVAS